VWATRIEAELAAFDKYIVDRISRKLHHDVSSALPGMGRAALDGLFLMHLNKKNENQEWMIACST